MFVYLVSQYPLLVILLIIRGSTIQGSLEIHIITVQGLFSHLYSQLYWRIFLIFLLYHHGNHLMRKQLHKKKNHNTILDRMQWTNIMSTIIKRIMNGPFLKYTLFIY